MKPQMISDNALALLKENSFRNFHAKGLDYLCFQRTDALTLKIYFFDSPPPDAQIVNPHDHRYDFSTAVIAGAVTDSIWRETHESVPFSRPFARFHWMTPLLGGAGFTYAGLTTLKLDGSMRWERGQSWQTDHRAVHTLTNIIPGTILALEQRADRLPVGMPTHCYVRNDGQPPQAPDLTGLYDRMDADQILARLKQLEAAQPGALSWLKGQ